MGSRMIRERARQLLAGKWGMAILVTFVAGLFGATLANAGGGVEFEFEEDQLKLMPEIVKTYLTIALSIGGILGLAQFILGGVVRLGYCKYLLKLHDGQEGNVPTCFRNSTGLVTALF